MYNLGASPVIINCEFRGNAAGIDGGGIYNEDSSPIIINSRFEENGSKYQGDEICNEGGSITIINTVFTSFYHGQFIYNSKTDMTITNTTFVGNDNSTGIYNSWSSPIITNCIFDNFTDKDSYSVYNFPSKEYPSNPTISYSNVEGGCENIPGVICGEGNIDEDPMFVDFDNGDFHLLEGSPCIDTALNDALPSDEFDLDDDGDTDELIPYDLDGNDRIVNKIVDMGAYEFQGK